VQKQPHNFFELSRTRKERGIRRERWRDGLEMFDKIGKKSIYEDEDNQRILRLTAGERGRRENEREKQCRY
jgi:hypothetical protein